MLRSGQRGYVFMAGASRSIRPSRENTMRWLRWSRLFGQVFRWDKWIVCRG